MSNPSLNMIDDAGFAAFANAGMADAALYVPAAGGAQVACTVIVDKSMREYGFESQVGNALTTIRARINEVGTPQRGATFVVGADQYVVDCGAPLEADESAVLLTVKQVAP
ncbi:MAG: hypothetical protein L0H70_05610 [Xanthomonadales bacterium]|nr:hypothetical protein [Xanthomonadales bacterium]